MTTLIRLALQWGPHPGPHGPMGPGGAPGGWMPWFGAGGGAGFPWPLLALLLLAAVLIGGAYLAVRLPRERETAPDASPALAVLRRRYAAGEIDDEEFEARRDRLSEDSLADPPT